MLKNFKILTILPAVDLFFNIRLPFDLSGDGDEIGESIACTGTNNIALGSSFERY